MSTHEQFLSEIELFLTRSGMKPTTLGLQALNDAKFVPNLRNGADVTTRTMDRVRAFISSHEKKVTSKHRTEVRVS